MSFTALKAVSSLAVLMASFAAPFLIQHHADVKAREKDATLRQQSDQLAELSAGTQRLSNVIAQSAAPALSKEEVSELLKLRAEVRQLHSLVKEMEQWRARNVQLTAQRSAPQSQPETTGLPDPQKVQAYWPKTQLANAGYADPASALQTALLAMSRGDADLLVASVTPEAHSRLTREQWNRHGPPAEEIAAATAWIAASLAPSSGFYIVGQNTSDQNETIFDVFFEGEGRTRKVALKRIGSEWKFDSLSNGLWP